MASIKTFYGIIVNYNHEVRIVKFTLPFGIRISALMSLISPWLNSSVLPYLLFLCDNNLKPDRFRIGIFVCNRKEYYANLSDPNGPRTGESS